MANKIKCKFKNCNNYISNAINSDICIIHELKETKRKKNTRIYIKNYMRKRYNEDEKFREKAKNYMRNYAKKRYHEDDEYRKKQNEYNKKWRKKIQIIKKNG